MTKEDKINIITTINNAINGDGVAEFDTSINTLEDVDDTCIELVKSHKIKSYLMSGVDENGRFEVVLR